MATQEEAPQQPQKLGGIFWWLLLGLMIVSDIGCIIGNLLITGGLALTATAIGAVVGLPLAILGQAMSMFLSFNAFMFSTGYYVMNKVPLLEGRKIATMSVSAIIKLTPYVNLIPALTISFVAVTFMENAKRGSGIIGAVVRQTVERTPLGAMAVKVV